MSKQAKKHRKSVPVPPPASKQRAASWAGILLAIAIAAGAGIWWLTPKHQESQPPSGPAVETVPASRPAVAAIARPEFQRLKGRWLRPDGGYVIDVKSVDEGGRMEASYANPRPIHVAKAEASQDGAATKVFVELRDVNYPGSTYDLTYDPQRDRLEGIYYQAALQQSFEVFFVRME